MNDLVNKIKEANELLTVLLVFMPLLSGYMAMLASFFPPPDPNFKYYFILVKLRKLINFLGWNSRNAKNKD